MSRVHLYRITRNIKTYNIYVACKRKERKHRESIRLMLKIMKRFNCHNNKCIQKEVWDMILKKIPDSPAGYKEHQRIMDMAPKDMTVDEFRNELTRTLCDSSTLAKNPLYQSTSADATEALDKYIPIVYGNNVYSITLSLIAQAFNPTKGYNTNSSARPCVWQSINHGDIFLGIHCTVTHANMNDNIWINGVELKLKDGVRVIPNLVDSSSFTTNRGKTYMGAFIFFPNLGPIITHRKGVTTVETKNDLVIHNFAFGMCSAALKSVLNNK